MKKSVLILCVFVFQFNLFSQNYFENHNNFYFTHFLINNTIEYPAGEYDAGFTTTPNDTSNELEFNIGSFCGNETSAIIIENSNNNMTVLSRTGTTLLDCNTAAYPNSQIQEERLFDIMTGYYNTYPDNPLMIYYNISADEEEVTIWTDVNEKLVFQLDHTCCGSVADNKLKNKFKIYPNPINNKLNIHTSIANYSVAIYTILGQQVLNKQCVLSNKLNLSKLSNGIYLLKITNGKNSFTKKFIKE